MTNLLFVETCLKENLKIICVFRIHHYRWEQLVGFKRRCLFKLFSFLNLCCDAKILYVLDAEVCTTPCDICAVYYDEKLTSSFHWTNKKLTTDMAKQSFWKKNHNGRHSKKKYERNSSNIFRYKWEADKSRHFLF